MEDINKMNCPYCGHQDIDLGRADDLCREREDRTGYCPACAKQLCVSYIRRYTNNQFFNDDDVVIESTTTIKLYPYRIENVVKSFNPNKNRIKTYNDFYVIQSIIVDE